MPLNPLTLFKECLQNKEPLFDSYYLSDELIISKDANKEKTEIMKVQTLLVERISAAKLANEDGDQNSYKKHIKEIDKILTQNKFVQFLEFPSFFPTIDISFSIYKNWEDKNRINWLKESIKHYIKARHNTYISHGHSPTTLQARKDFAKHKRQGSFAKNKIQNICTTLKYKLPKSNQINNGEVCFIDNNQGRKLLENVIKKEREKWYGKWSEKHQGKVADFLFSGKNKYFICEAKHLKESGGGQDKQISELISFISNKGKSTNNIHYIAFLDGIYFNEFISPQSDKIKKQKKDIIKCLKFHHKKNFFVNTYGLKKLLKYFR